MCAYLPALSDPFCLIYYLCVHYDAILSSLMPIMFSGCGNHGDIILDVMIYYIKALSFIEWTKNISTHTMFDHWFVQNAEHISGVFSAG